MRSNKGYIPSDGTPVPRRSPPLAFLAPLMMHGGGMRTAKGAHVHHAGAGGEILHPAGGRASVAVHLDTHLRYGRHTKQTVDRRVDAGCTLSDAMVEMSTAIHKSNSINIVCACMPMGTSEDQRKTRPQGPNPECQT